jgi:glyoxylase-like metal-dependent hydrolase (beta-lactamase superfamily II)
MVIAVLGLIAATQAKATAQGTSDADAVVTTTRVSGNFYSLSVPGGTVGALVGSDGILMIDTQYSPVTDKMIAALRQISSLPIRFLINTHYHGDHAGGNEKVAKLGATIFARDEVRESLKNPGNAPDGTPIPPTAPAGLPMVTFRDGLTLHMDDEEVSVIPIAHAHSGGDSIVVFHSADVIMTGDIFRSVGFPLLDARDGGTFNGMIDGVGAILGMAGPNTKIVPGHGPTTDRAAVIVWRDMLTSVRDRVEEMIRQGKTKEETMAAHITGEFEAKTGRPADSGARFVGQVYAELK